LGMISRPLEQGGKGAVLWTQGHIRLLVMHI
jgi:hypothetical protein